MNDIILDNQLQLLMGSCPKEAEKLGIELIIRLTIKGEKDKIKQVKAKLGISLYNSYAQKAIDKIKDTM